MVAACLDVKNDHVAARRIDLGGGAVAEPSWSKEFAIDGFGVHLLFRQHIAIDEKTRMSTGEETYRAIIIRKVLQVRSHQFFHFSVRSNPTIPLARGNNRQ